MTWELESHVTPVKEQCGEDEFQSSRPEPRREDLSLRRVARSVDGIEEAVEMYEERTRRKGTRTFILVSIELPGRGKQGNIWSLRRRLHWWESLEIFQIILKREF